MLANRNAGSRLILHDDPGCDLKHDYAEITVHEDIALATIDTFEKEQVDPRFTVHFVKGDDGVLDGKVSYLSVLRTGARLAESGAKPRSGRPGSCRERKAN